MNNEEVRKLIDIRAQVIACHDALDGKGVTGAMVKQENVAHEFSLLVKRLDDILKEYVAFQ